METQYLLDTNICANILRGGSILPDILAEKGWGNCYISEITKAELIYGAECSHFKDKNMTNVLALCRLLKVVPISDVLGEYARQKARLRSLGTMIEDADIFIGCTAIVYNMVMVTGNVKHIGRLSGITIENWAAGQTE